VAIPAAAAALTLTAAAAVGSDGQSSPRHQTYLNPLILSHLTPYDVACTIDESLGGGDFSGGSSSDFGSGGSGRV